MTPLDDDTQLRALLAPLHRIEPVTLAPRRPSRRRALVPLVAAAALIVVGVAIAAGLNPFAGITAAQHGQRPQDVINPKLLARIMLHEKRMQQVLEDGLFAHIPGPGIIIPKTTRLLGQVTSNTEIYVATTTKNVLLTILVQPEAYPHQGQLHASISSGTSLSEAHPVTIGTVGPDSTSPISFGLAENGVTAVSFRAGGKERTVPVRDNVWFYVGESSALASITVHYANGKTKTLTH